MISIMYHTGPEKIQTAGFALQRGVATDLPDDIATALLKKPIFIQVFADQPIPEPTPEPENVLNKTEQTKPTRRK